MIEAEKENLPKRKNHRYRGFDYSQPGIYFLTLCTFEKQRVLGKIVFDFDSETKLQTNVEFVPSATGKIVDKIWREIPLHYPNVELKRYVIMPNHIHALIEIKESEIPGPGIPVILSSFKSISTKRFHLLTPGKSPLWQRNYYDSIIKNDKQLENVDIYILENPYIWAAGKDPEM